MFYYHTTKQMFYYLKGTQQMFYYHKGTQLNKCFTSTRVPTSFTTTRYPTKQMFYYHKGTN